MGTVLVAAIVAIYVAFVTVGDVPVRGIALLGLILGYAAYLELGPVMHAPSALRTFIGALGLAVLGLGIATMAIESEPLLAAFIGAIVALWMAAMLRSAGVLESRTARQPPGEHRSGPLAVS